MAKTKTRKSAGPTRTAPKKAASKKATATKPVPRKAAPKKAARKAAPKKTAAVASSGKAAVAVKKAAKRVTTAASSAVSAVKQAATKAAKRVVPKRSASYGMAIDDFAAKLPEWQQQVVRELVALVKSVSPTTTGSIKWGQPVFDLNGPFAFIKPAKAHMTFGFWRGTELTDPEGLLEGAGDRMKHLKIAKGDAIPAKVLRRLIDEAVRLNDAHGDPTKRKRA